MNEEIMLRMNEEGVFEPYEPYMVVECETKEDYDRLVELVELGKAVVFCKDCAVPHNKWTGCPKMNGTIMPPDGFCSYGERRADHAAQEEKPHAGPDRGQT